METASLQLTLLCHPPLYLIFQKEHSSIQIKHTAFHLSLYGHLAIDSSCTSLKQKFKICPHRSPFHKMLFSFSKTFNSWPSLIGLMNFLVCFCRWVGYSCCRHGLSHLYPQKNVPKYYVSIMSCHPFLALTNLYAQTYLNFFSITSCFPSSWRVTVVKAPLPMFWPAITFSLFHQRYSQQNVMVS